MAEKNRLVTADAQRVEEAFTAYSKSETLRVTSANR
jgi:hypothetical protein